MTVNSVSSNNTVTNKAYDTDRNVAIKPSFSETKYVRPKLAQAYINFIKCECYAMAVHGFFQSGKSLTILH
jgi:hypothetical protein